MKVYAKSTEAGASVEIFSRCSAERKSTRNTRERLKDLPNMSFHLKRFSGRWGLRMYGRYVYLGQNVLVATAAAKQSGDRKDSVMLEGAIIGIHEAALPVARRQSLQNGLTLLRRNRSFLRNLIIWRCRRPISGSNAINNPTCVRPEVLCCLPAVQVAAFAVSAS